MSDPFIHSYETSELKIAAEFLTNWLPFLTRDLCPDCTQSLRNRVQSLDPGIAEGRADAEQSPHRSQNDCSENLKDSSCNAPESPSSHDNSDTNSLGSWKEGANEWSENLVDRSGDSTNVRMSWADMAQEEDQLEETGDASGQLRADEFGAIGEGEKRKTVEKQKLTLTRDQREYIRFMNVQRKKDFICLERINGKIVNILDGLELHTGVFSAAEQKRIVDFVYDLQKMGRKGQLKERTYSEPVKWVWGKGRVTIQFGCCYNYAEDKDGNPPGILRNKAADPIPDLFKVMIRRLIGWHVLPPSCIPDSCIVNIYEEGDCIPPHIDSHDFVRPFCTVSFLSECNMLFGSSLKIAGPGEFPGSTAIPMPVGSVLVLKGNGADIAKHCVPAVPTKRMSITFRKMDENKRPFCFVMEPDLEGIQPLSYRAERSKHSKPSRPQQNANRRLVIHANFEGDTEPVGRSPRSEPTISRRAHFRSADRLRVRPNTPKAGSMNPSIN